MWELKSSLYLEGKAAGLAEARLEHRREWCAAFARKYHPAVFDRVEAIIAACEDPDRLMEWMLTASDLSDAEFLELLGA